MLESLTISKLEEVEKCESRKATIEQESLKEFEAIKHEFEKLKVRINRYFIPHLYIYQFR